MSRGVTDEDKKFMRKVDEELAGDRGGGNHSTTVTRTDGPRLRRLDRIEELDGDEEGDGTSM